MTDRTTMRGRQQARLMAWRERSASPDMSDQSSDSDVTSPNLSPRATPSFEDRTRHYRVRDMSLYLEEQAAERIARRKFSGIPANPNFRISDVCNMETLEELDRDERYRATKVNGRLIFLANVDDYNIEYWKEMSLKEKEAGVKKVWSRRSREFQAGLEYWQAVLDADEEDEFDVDDNFGTREEVEKTVEHLLAELEGCERGRALELSNVQRQEREFWTRKPRP
ncbi:MAG: hypothetical protein M1812_001421 [Candelaria pacifica]|nr:MAG: hypothetical protein M1812_001421 [Candelaria pacifica]